MVERVERKSLGKVSGVEFSRVCCESFLTAHCVGYEIVGWFISEAFCAPRVLGDWVDELDGTPTAERHRKPFRPEGSAEAVNRLIIVSYHHQVIDVFDAVQAGQTLATAVAANRRALGISSQSVEHINRHRNALVGARYKIVRAVQTSLDVPKQMFRSRAVNRSVLRRR